MKKSKNIARERRPAPFCCYLHLKRSEMLPSGSASPVSLRTGTSAAACIGCVHPIPNAPMVNPKSGGALRQDILFLGALISISQCKLYEGKVEDRGGGVGGGGPPPSKLGVLDGAVMKKSKKHCTGASPGSILLLFTLKARKKESIRGSPGSSGSNGSSGSRGPCPRTAARHLPSTRRGSG